MRPPSSVLVAAVLFACSVDTATPPANVNPPVIPTPLDLVVTGRGSQVARYNAEVWVRGTVAYTTTWSTRGANVGNAIYIWDVAGLVPRLADSVIVSSGATTLGDVQTSDDGRLLVVPTELAPGSIIVFDLTDPFKPVQLSRFTSARITRGVHTCEVQRVNGKLYAFLSVNRGTALASQLMIVDLSDPSNPTEVTTIALGNPFIHDVFVRDGMLFTALWDDGLSIYDIGGGGRGGTVASPVFVGNVRTRDGEVHNAWWYHDGQTGSKQFVFVGEEGSASLFTSSVGDIHVVDISTPTTPVEVAFFRSPGAGTHNFSVDEAQGVLYAAYYNGGVQVLDVRGDLGSCNTAAKASDGRCDLQKAGRLLARATLDQGMPVFIWGVHLTGGFVYASDMLNGIWKIRPYNR